MAWIRALPELVSFVGPNDSVEEVILLRFLVILCRFVVTAEIVLAAGNSRRGLWRRKQDIEQGCFIGSWFFGIVINKTLDTIAGLILAQRCRWTGIVDISRCDDAAALSSGSRRGLPRLSLM